MVVSNLCDEASKKRPAECNKNKYCNQKGELSVYRWSAINTDRLLVLHAASVSSIINVCFLSARQSWLLEISKIIDDTQLFVLDQPDGENILMEIECNIRVCLKSKRRENEIRRIFSPVQFTNLHRCCI